MKNPDGSQGYTWNPITGCLNGCPYCYARKLANGRLRSRYLQNACEAPIGKSPEGYDLIAPNAHKDPFYPRFWSEKLEELDEREDLHYQRKLNQVSKPKGIFVCDMSDLFGIGIPEDWTNQILERIKANWSHRFYLLTKQPQNLQKFSPFPDNCWVGVTATNPKMAEDAGYYLSQIKAKVRYLSLEPLLERCCLYFGEREKLDWLIIGAQTKPTVYPKIEWVQEIVEAADKAGVPVFLKDNIIPLFKTKYGNAEFYIKKHRQEVPA